MAFFSSNPSEEDLLRDWTLDERERSLVQECRVEFQRRWFALQLCSLRQWGRFLESGTEVPVRIVNYVGQQMGLPTVLSLKRQERQKTRHAHGKRIRKYLGYVLYNSKVENQLAAVLGDYAVESVLPEELLWKAEELLRIWKVVRPASSTLERVVATVFTKAQDALFNRISGLVPEATRTAIDKLLEVGEGEFSPLAYLKNSPPAASHLAMGELLAQHKKLAALGLEKIDWSGVSPAMIWHLAALTRQYDAWSLRRFESSKRQALLSCFLLETRKTLLDNLAKMHDQLMTDLDRRSRRASQHDQAVALRKHLESLDTLIRAGKILVKLKHRPSNRRELDLFDCEKLQKAIQESEEFQNLESGLAWVLALRRRYGVLKQYWPEFLELPFASDRPSSALMNAIEIARNYYRHNAKALAKNVPVLFIENPLRSALRQADGRIDPMIWHWGLALAVKKALRSGDLFLVGSRGHVSFWNMLYPAQRWQSERPQVYQQLELPTSGADVLQRLRQEMEENAAALINGLSTNPLVRIERGVVRLSRLKALELSPQVHALRQAIQGLLPTVRIEDLLMQVDQQCHFTQAFQPLDGYQSHRANPRLALFATLIAHGTNLGLSAMSNSVRELTPDILQNVSQWFIREGTLKAANAMLVNFHHRLKMSSIYGDGTFSSSDGQRFGLRRSALIGALYPRFFGYYDRVVSFYNHVSSQFSVFGTQAIVCSDRESLYVLNGLLENETDLRPYEHTSDTHGYTEQMFGLCFLLGFSFMPRIKGTGDQQLYRMDAKQRFGDIDHLFVDTIDMNLILEQWDPLVRLAASLRNRLAPAHIIVQRLINTGAASPLGRALIALGRLVKTIYILRFLHDNDLRRRILVQLNRGENRHSLVRSLFFAQQGEIYTGDYAELMNKASCVSLLSNAVLVWNTIQFEKIVTKLRSEGHTIRDEDLAHVTPLLHSHVIPHGAYFVNQSDLGD